MVGSYLLGPGGKTYVVFGKTLWNSIPQLSSLNGQNGFELDGTTAGGTGDGSGCSIAAGDINNDGLNDLVIGASGAFSGTGKTYLVFGRSSWENLYQLNSLNGTEGFILYGVAPGTSTGSFVSAAGDINHDGINDLIIGAIQANKNYVVFGKSNWANSSLSSLNGINGFEVDCISGDNCGNSAAAVDINHDGIDDLVLGAPGSSSTNPGKTYVVFGKTMWSTPFSVVNLNGFNGFELDGVVSGDNSGNSVSAAGDINFDGIEDLVIGAPGLSWSGAGKTYVVFGKASWTSRFSLNNLNGTNGFELDGVPGDNSGWSVAGAGDVNADGIGDLVIGAFAGLSTAGRTYIVFGDSPPVLMNNRLTIMQGERVLLNPSFLSAYDLNHDNNTLVFTPSNVVAGQFEMTNNPGIALNSFAQQQIINGTIQFAHNGSAAAPGYDIGVTTTGLAYVPPQTANINFSLMPARPFPVLLQNSLSLSNGQLITLTSSNLRAIETNFNVSQLVFIISNLQQGNFYRLPENITTFTFAQSYIEQGRIQFLHNGNNIAASYLVVVNDGNQTTLPSAANVNFQGAPSVDINVLNTMQNQAITLNSQLITIASPYAANLINLRVSNLQHVAFINLQNGLGVLNFTYADLQASIIQMQPDGSPVAPSFTLVVSTPSGTTSEITPSISFSAQGVLAPNIVTNFLGITQGQSTILSALNVQAMQGSQPLPSTAGFYVSNVQQGFFSLTNGPANVQISYFTQNQLQQGLVQFTQDGSAQLPSYSIVAEVNGARSANSQAGVFFTPVHQPPQLTRPLRDQLVTVGQPFSFGIQNSFVDPQGETITLTASVANNTFLPSWVNFNAVQQRFSGTAAQTGITSMQVTATNADSLSATGYFAIDAQAAPNNTPYLERALISAGVSGAIGVGFYLLKLGLKRAADNKLLESLKHNQEEFDKEVVTPIAAAISKRIKITGFTGISESTLEEFKGAVRTLIAAIGRHIDIQLGKMAIDKRDETINVIATETKLYLSEKRSCGKAFCSFFTAEASPEDIRKAAPQIAERVAGKIGHRGESQVMMAPLSNQIEVDSEPQSLDLKLRQ